MSTMLALRAGSSALALLAGVLASAPAVGQMSIGSTTGILPPADPTESLLLGEDLTAFRASWLVPVTEQQRIWRDDTVARAGQATSGGVPPDFTTAVIDASIAQAAALRWAMGDDAGDLAKAIDVLLVLEVPWGTQITRTEVMTSYLCAYDYVRGADPVELPQAVRDLIEGRLLSQAESLTTGFTASNARAKVGATRALAGVLLRDQTLLDRGLGDLQAHFDYSTTDDGWFTDSQGHYLNYTLSHLAPFLRAYERGSGVDLYPNLAPYAEMSIGLRMPGGRVPNVSNGTNTPVAVHLFSQTPDPQTAGRLMWNLTDGVPAAYVWTTTNVLNNDWHYTSFFGLTDFANVPPAAPPVWTSFFARGQSKVTVLRRDWSEGSDWLCLSPGIDSPAGLLGIPAFHSHNDTLELLVCAKGEYLLVAPGYARDDLSNSPPGFTPRRADWHNVLLVDGDVGAGEQGRKMRPGDFDYAPPVFGAVGGSASATLSTHYRSTDVSRSVSFPGNDHFVVRDTLNSSSVHEYGLNLVGRGTLTILVETPELIRVRWAVNGHRATVTVTASEPLRLETASLWMHDTYNVFEPTQRMTAILDGADAQFLTVITTR
ncbi:MAG TPA: heparinase II/III family protein [Planctomycetota bacterium]|nr:heparinase II/III family protein [Planctomycetota bacterium]